MKLRILDLDGGLLPQHRIRSRYRLGVHPLESWGPRIRLACSFRRFQRFERALEEHLGAVDEPLLALYGSGDFHHVSLALLHRLKTPCNLLVFDNHPDWMRGVPLLHCGTWLLHAARLPGVQRIFHVGGDVDFDNSWRFLAPWKLLREGKITVFPSVRRFTRGAWATIGNTPLRTAPSQPLSHSRIEELLAPHSAELSRCPLYISVDKDVMVQTDSIVNWDSGHLTLPEVQELLTGFLRAANGKLAGMDILGDWSPVHTQGLLRSFLHHTEHPVLNVRAAESTRVHEVANSALLETVDRCRDGGLDAAWKRRAV